jgi:hypothetical protein
MSSEFFTINESYTYLSTEVLLNVTGREEVLSLCAWMIEWNNLLPENEKIICYMRDFKKNIGFMVDLPKNRNKINKPNFLVIKLPGTDIVEFTPYLLLDFYLTRSGYDQYKDFIRQRPSNPARWVVIDYDINRLGMINAQALIQRAHQLRRS